MSGGLPLSVVGGAVLDNSSLRIEPAYTRMGLVLDEKGHILSYLGERWIDLLSPGTRLEVTTQDARTGKARLVGVDEPRRFAVVQCTDLQLKTTPVESRSTLEAGLPVKEIELLRSPIVRVIHGKVARWDAQGETTITLEKRGIEVGGPVLSNEGKVWGVVTEHAGPKAPGQRSTAMVAPIAEVLPAAQQIINTRKSIAAGWIGIYINDLVDELRLRLNLKTGSGILAREIAKGSPAEKAGLQAGDVIQSINRQAVPDIRTFIRRLQSAAPGQTVTLTVARGGGVKDYPVKVDRRPPEKYTVLQPFSSLEFNAREVIAKLQELDRKHRRDLDAVRRRVHTAALRQKDLAKLEAEFEASKKEAIESQVRLAPARRNASTMGVFCAELSPQLGQFFGVRNGKGILTDSVLPSTPGEVAGLKAGDVILMVENREMAECADLSQVFQKRRPGDKIKVTILREKKPLELYVTLDKAVGTAFSK